jgi:hypothetical protein
MTVSKRPVSGEPEVAFWIPYKGCGDPDLARVIGVWDSLPQHIPDAILAFIQTAGK